MSFLDSFGAATSRSKELERLRTEREEARTLAARLHNDLDRVSQEAEVARQRAFGTERALKAAQDEAKRAKLALLQAKQQTDALREELVHTQQFAADRAAAAGELQASLLETKTGLQHAEATVAELRRERCAEPISDVDLLVRFKRLREAFESLQATLTCPICFEPIARDLCTFSCGHSSCLPCAREWAVRSATNKYHATKGADIRPECPECRGVGGARIQVYVLEELARILARVERDDLADVAGGGAATGAAAAPGGGGSDGDEMDVAPAATLDDEAAAILRPRQRQRYAGMMA